MSRDDLISEGGANPLRGSRSTVREIPIQRSASAFAPSIGMSSTHHPHLSTNGNVTTTGGLYGGASSTTANPYPYSSNSSHLYTTKYQPHGGGPPQEEYYRREVLTRTLVTRSTEALSAPPLSRSSPINILDQLRALPEPSGGGGGGGGSGRDEVSEEYWYKYSRNVEEEERRIRENQVHLFDLIFCLNVCLFCRTNAKRKRKSVAYARRNNDDVGSNKNWNIWND